MFVCVYAREGRAYTRTSNVCIRAFLHLYKVLPYVEIVFVYTHSSVCLRAFARLYVCAST